MFHRLFSSLQKYIEFHGSLNLWPSQESCIKRGKFDQIPLWIILEILIKIDNRIKLEKYTSIIQLYLKSWKNLNFLILNSVWNLGNLLSDTFCLISQRNLWKWLQMTLSELFTRLTLPRYSKQKSHFQREEPKLSKFPKL